MAYLSEAQRRQFDEQGYLVVEHVLDPLLDLQPVLDEYSDVLDGIAVRLQEQGILTESYDEMPFTKRLVRICAESGRNFPQEFDISLPQADIKVDTPIHVGPAVFRLLTQPHLLDLVEDICGPEIYSNPVQHIRMKLPSRAVAAGSTNGLVTKIPWHQDNGVVLPEADEASILTIWMPLTEATRQNGCMQVLPGSHRGQLVAHCPTAKGAAIPDRLVDEQEAVVLPMRVGSVLLMHQKTIHSSLDNLTPDEVRISFDLRYQPVGQPSGRPAFPGFVARSQAHPESVLSDAAAWAELWYAARARLAPEESTTFNRWRAGEGVCA